MVPDRGSLQGQLGLKKSRHSWAPPSRRPCPGPPARVCRQASMRGFQEPKKQPAGPRSCPPWGTSSPGPKHSNLLLEPCSWASGWHACTHTHTHTHRHTETHTHREMHRHTHIHTHTHTHKRTHALHLEMPESHNSENLLSVHVLSLEVRNMADYIFPDPQTPSETKQKGCTTSPYGRISWRPPAATSPSLSDFQLGSQHKDPIASLCTSRLRPVEYKSVLHQLPGAFLKRYLIPTLCPLFPLSFFLLLRCQM